MSDTFLRLIPAQPEFVPPVEAAETALGEFQKIVPREVPVTAERFNQITFVDQGGHFERIICPHCKADVTENLDRWMDASSQTNFTMRHVTLPCCRANEDLNDLIWEWPAGFASFKFEAMNPQRNWLTEPEQSTIESTLGCKICQIIAHY
jgi:hypothetical protein